MKNKEMTDFLIKRIKRTEKSVLDNNGTVPYDFDKLVRYHAVLKCYDFGKGPKSDDAKAEIKALKLEIEALTLEGGEIEELQEEIKALKKALKKKKTKKPATPPEEEEEEEETE